MLWLNLCLLLLFLRLVLAVVGLREYSCSERLPVVMVCAVGQLSFSRVYSPEAPPFRCRRRQTGGYRDRQGKRSELLRKVIAHLLRTKGYVAPVCRCTEAKPTSVQQPPDPTSLLRLTPGFLQLLSSGSCLQAVDRKAQRGLRQVTCS
ncbi:hypothetical protein PAECIP111893_05356 [Paenibacillus plantiphilus]|uniref:Secreted protein n=1 Tax=Paenibacillus plantiphilus TaxID=2905650 RepID=A0ABN8H834_9BACL|nr:hypothetical protein PAECIP111893_05356 [Paenibacillus plantiphilus]